MTQRAAVLTRMTGREWVQAGLAGLVAVVVAFIRNHAWATPNITFFSSLAKNWGSNTNGVSGGYLLTNWLPTTVAHFTGQTEGYQIVRLHLLVWMIAVIAIVIWATRRYGARAGWMVALIVALAPSSTTTLEWLGQPDSYTTLMAVALVLCHSRWAAVCWAIALGMTHPEQGIVIALTASLGWAVLQPVFPTFRQVLSRVGINAIGVMVGRACTELYLRVNDLQITKSRWQLIGRTWRHLLDHHLLAPGWALYALFGPLWLLLAVHVWRATRSGSLDRHRWELLGLGCLVAFGATAITLDHTRVFGMITLPLLVAAAIRMSMELEVRLRVVVATALIGACIPGVFTAGKQYWATDLPLDEFIPFVRDGTVPGDDPTLWAIKPFPFLIPAA